MKKLIKLIFDQDIIKKITQTSLVKYLTTFLLATINLLLIRKLSIETYGIYNYLLAIINVCIQIFVTGFSASITYFGSVKQKNQIIKLLKYAFTLNILIVIIFLILNQKFYNYGYLVSLVFLLSAISIYLNSILLSQKEITSINIGEIIYALLYFLIILIFYYLSKLNLTVIFLIASLGLLIKSGYYLFKIKAKKIFNQEKTKKEKQSENMTQFIIRASIINIAAFLLLKSDIILLKFYKDSYDVGVYSLAVNLGDLFIIVPGVAASISFPYFAEKVVKKAKINKKLTLFLSLIMALVLLAFFAGLGKNLIALIGGPKYKASLMPFLILSPGIFFLSLQIVPQQYINAHKFPLSIVYIWIFGFIFNILLNLFLIPKYSYNGAALSSSIAYFIVSAYIIYVYLSNNFTESKLK